MSRFYDTETLESRIFGEDGGLEELLDPEPEGMEAIEVPEEPHPVMIDVTLEDGRQERYTTVGVFLEGEKEYIALETEAGDIYIMELAGGENDRIRLLPIEEEEEQERAVEAFRYYFEDPGRGRDENSDHEAERENEHDRDQNREKN